jgi:hypothetical protein
MEYLSTYTPKSVVYRPDYKIMFVMQIQFNRSRKKKIYMCLLDSPVNKLLEYWMDLPNANVEKVSCSGTELNRCAVKLMLSK